MKLPRFSIISVMWIVGIASIDFAALRVLEGPTTDLVQILVIVSMPMASILMIGIPTLVKGLLGRGKIPPFLLGFEGFGWTILLFCTGMALLVSQMFCRGRCDRMGMVGAYRKPRFVLAVVNIL